MGKSRGKKYVILAIEDSNDDFFATQRALEKCDYNFDLIRFFSAEEGLIYLDTIVNGGYAQEGTASLPDMILMDLNLPGINGIEAIRRIKNKDIFVSIPVVMLSSSTSEHDIKEAYEAGAVQYLHKGLDLALFFNRVREITQQCLVISL